MRELIQNYLISAFLLALLLAIVIFSLMPIYPSLKGAIPDETFFKFFAVLFQFLWLPLIGGAYFIFKDYPHYQAFEIKNYLPTFAIFLGAFFFVILIQCFAPNYLIEKLFAKRWSEDLKYLSQLIKTEKDLSSWERLYAQDKLKNKKAYELRLQTLNYDFPTDLNIAKRLRALRVDSFADQEDLGPQVIDPDSQLEAWAIELRNKGDYLAAAELYKKLIAFYPDSKDFKKKREGYQDALAICLAKDKNEESKLLAEDLLELRINKDLERVARDWEEGNIFRALAKIVQLRIDYDHLSVRALYNKIVGDWQQNEFHLTPFIYQKRLWADKMHHSKVSFKHQTSYLQVDKVYPYDGFLYLEGITLSNSQLGTVNRYRYGCLRHHTFFLKNKRYTKSLKIKGDFHPLISEIAVQYQRHDFLLVTMGVPDLFTYVMGTGKLSKPEMHFYQWLINVKINLWIWGLGLFFLLSAFSYRNSYYLLSPWAVLGAFFITLFSLALYGGVAYSVATLIDNYQLFHFITYSFSIICCVMAFVYFSLSSVYVERKK